MGVPHACVHVHHMCTWCPQKSEGGVEFPGIRVMDGVNHYLSAGN